VSGAWGRAKTGSRRHARVRDDLPADAITGYHVITNADDCSDHRPVTATFDMDVAARLRTAA
jgi:hypothetical protein